MGDHSDIADLILKAKAAGSIIEAVARDIRW